jgi:hypothetical protein
VILFTANFYVYGHASQKSGKSYLRLCGILGHAFIAIQNIPDKGYVYRQFKTTKEWVDAFLTQKRTGIPDLETWIKTIVAENRDK